MISGSGYAPGETVNVTYNGVWVASFTANAGGTFSGTLLIPATNPVTGTYEVTATGGTSLATATVAFNQTPLTFALAVTLESESAAAGGGSVGLNANSPGAAWTATANAPWLQLTGANGAAAGQISGTGSGNVGFRFAADPGATRSGTLTIAGQTLTVTQAGSQPTTIDPLSRYAYGENIGWIDWNQGVNGALIGENVCSGFIYSANVGWINLGSGSPANGVSYENDSVSDFGVNIDGSGNLRGLAWGANVGWINFEETGAAAVDLTTGQFGGYAWGANCGWISLSTGYGVVAAGLVAPAPVPGINNWATTTGQPLVVPVAKMLAGAVSPDGGTLRITAVNSPSAQGGTVSLAAGVVTYVPPTAYAGSFPLTDEFTYTLSDGLESSQGTVSVTVRSPDQQSQNGLGTIGMSGGHPVIGFLGIPGMSYLIQWTASLAAPISWTNLATVTADATGLISYTDTTAPLPDTRYYRTVAAP
jgi:hypothetical protein